MKKKYLEPTAEMLVLVNETAFICASYKAPKADSWDLDIDDVADNESFWSTNY